MTRILQISPTAKALWQLFAAECCSMVGQVDAEKRCYRAAIEVYPVERRGRGQAMRTRLTLTRLLLAGTDEEFAEGQTALQAIEIDLKKSGLGTTANDARLCGLQGYAAQRNGDHFGAVDLYKKSHAKFEVACLLCTGHIEVLQLLAWLLQDLGRTEEGEYFGRRAASLRRIYMGRAFEVRYRHP
jgi:hypothetical protein